MAFEVGSIMARLQLDSSGYTRGILNVQSMNAVFGNSVTQFINNPLLSTIGIFKSAVVGIGRYTLNLLEAAEAHQRLSQQTGVSTDVTQALTREFELAGRATTQAEMAIRTFNTRLQQARDIGGPAAEVFERLGVSITPDQSTDEVFRKTINNLLEYGDVARAGAIASQLFGEEAGGALLETVATGGGIEEIIAKMRDFGLVMNESVINRMAEMNTTSGEVKLALEGVKQSLAATFAEGATNNVRATTEDIRDMSKALREDLTPAADGAGFAVRLLLQAAEKYIELNNFFGRGVGDQINGPGSIGRAILNTQMEAELAGMRERAILENGKARAAQLAEQEVMPGR